MKEQRLKAEKERHTTRYYKNGSIKSLHYAGVTHYCAYDKEGQYLGYGATLEAGLEKLNA